MTDQPGPQPTPETPHPDESVFGRFFPGPTPRDPRTAARLEAIVRATEQRAERQRQREQQRASGGRQHGAQATVPTTAATAEDLEKVLDAIHDQTDVLRALLDADIAIRDDSRSTAQNSRTFAIAGTVIAFFTMVAAVVTVIITFTV